MPDILGLSILIPVYNQPVTALVEELSGQAIALGLPFEIRCYDDASTHQHVLEQNQQLNHIPGVIYTILPRNLGRAAIRNLLAREAKYPLLLFLDCDVVISIRDFLQRYLQYAGQADVICGGHIYDAQQPTRDYLLHWNYGTYRESRPAAERSKQPYKSLLLSNLIIRKNLFEQIQLDESINSYGHEDTKFGYELRHNNIPVLHIDNPVVHVGLDNNAAFLEKTKVAVCNLSKIYKQSGLGSDTKLLISWASLRKLRLIGLFCFLYDAMALTIKNRLLSGKVNLILVDLYKLRNICHYMKSSS